ncbi:hypothetical protein H8959_006289 [Pygathrix nigripes]
MRARDSPAPRGARAAAGPRLVGARAARPLRRRASHARTAAPAQAGDSNGASGMGRVRAAAREGDGSLPRGGWFCPACVWRRRFAELRGSPARERADFRSSRVGSWGSAAAREVLASAGTQAPLWTFGSRVSRTPQQLSLSANYLLAIYSVPLLRGWGTVDNNGVIGLLEPMKKSMVPVQVQLDVPVVKVASGNDHLVMLTADGDLYTLGCGEQGQLGRVPELFANRGGRQGLERLLVPKCVMLKSRGSRGHVRFQDAFCGAYFTFAISHEGHVYGFGLSNYHQLGTPGTESCFIPQNLTSFKNSTKSWVGFSGGQHHTVCMDSEGKAYSLGRAEYGRLGLGEGAEEKSIPTLISRLPAVSSVACGASVGYAVTKDGRVFAWGMGTNYQLGTGQDEDAWSPVEMTGKQLENRVVLSVSSGGQHTVLLVKDKEQS